jgi:hypothetical protein
MDDSSHRLLIEDLAPCHYPAVARNIVKASQDNNLNVGVIGNCFCSALIDKKGGRDWPASADKLTKS